MPEFARPLPYVPHDLSPEEVAERFPNTVRELGSWVAQQIQASEQKILSDPRMSDMRVARALYAAENEISLDLNRRAEDGAVLTILLTDEGYKAAFILGDGTSRDGTVPTITNHNLLSVTHSDTLTGTVVRGDLIVGNSTPKWARLAKGTEGQVLVMGANDPAWTTRTYTARHFIEPHAFIQSQGTTMTRGFSAGTYPNMYLYWGFVDAPASGPQGLFASWKVPKEYVSGGTVKVFYTSEDLSDGTYHPRVHYLAVNEVASNATTGQEDLRGTFTTIEGTTGDLLLATTGGVVQQARYCATFDVGTLTGLAPNDLVEFHLDRDTTQDTFPGTIRFVGMAIDFTAST